MITSILTWFILSYGLMNIIVFSSLFQGVRNFFESQSNNTFNVYKPIFGLIHGIITCPMCFGFHGGWFLSLVIFSPIHSLYGVSENISWFFDGVLSSGAVWAINSVIEWFEENRR